MLIRPHLSPADNRRIQAMLFGNQNGDLRQQLLDGAPFLAELTHTAVPQRAASGTTATFTRATTSTWPNNDGYLVTGAAGEIGFVGARRVRNYVAGSSEDLSNAAWTAKSIGGAAAPTVTANQAVAPDGTLTASLITGGTSYPAVEATATVAYTAGVWLLSLYVKKGSGEIVLGFSVDGGDEAPFDTATGLAGSVGANISAAGSIDEGDYWRLYAVSTRTAVAKKPIIYNGFPTASSFYIWGAQLEDITGRTDQTTPSEYVSVGVPSDWAGDELVTNGTFDSGTDWTTDANITIGGGVMTCTLSGTSVGTSFSVVAGTKYVVSWDCTRYVAGANRVLVRKADTTVIGDQNVTGVTATGRYIREFTSDFTGTVQPQVEFPINGESDVDNVVIKPALYHGAGVDGVKCYATDINGAAIPSSTLLGYQAEGARTNLCLQSQTLGTTWATDGSVNVTENQYIAPDGTATMDQITSIAGASQHYLKQGITFSAATTTYSCYLKYVNNQWTALVMSNGGGLLAASFDLLNGVAGALAAGTTSTIEATAIPDVYRCSITGTMSAGAGNVYISPNATDSASLQNYTAAGTEAIGAWGAQVELGSSASSYIATTTVAVTRNADVLTYSSAGNIDGTKGWCYAEISTNWSVYPGSTHSAAGFGAATEGILSGGVSGVPTEIRAYDGTNSVTASGNPTMYLSPRKTAIGWGSSLTITQTGVTASGTFDGNIGTTAIGVGCSATGTQVWDGTIRNVRIGQRQLSASELQAITS